MTTPKVLFDECLGKPIAAYLDSLGELEDEESRPIVEHLLNIQSPGVRDEDWIPRIADEGWVIITADSTGSKKGKGVPLIRVCATFRITHVILSSRVSQWKTAEKITAISSVWRQIITLHREPPGTGYLITPISGLTEDRGRIRFIKRSTPNPANADGSLPFTGPPIDEKT